MSPQSAPSKTLTPSVGVIGLGYVGLPLATSYAEAGSIVVGVDASERVVAGLSSGVSHVEDVTNERLAQVADKLTISSSFEPLAELDAVFICVPTGLTDHREPDLGPLTAVADALGAVVRKGQVIILESTVYPGATRELLIPRLESTGLKVGTDIFVAHSPERIDPGRTDTALASIPKTVGGHTDECGRRAEEVLLTVFESVHRVSTPDAAEFSKLLENVFRSVNIALVNELAIFADRADIDIWEVIDAASTKPYGYMRFEPGPGMGGHCLPVDPFYLSWRARKYDSDIEFIELAGRLNDRMPRHCVSRIIRALNQDSHAVQGTKIAVFGVSYKAGTADVRESPVIPIIEQLLDRGGNVVYHDPHVPEMSDIGLKSQSVAEALDGAKIAVIATAHPAVDYEEIAARVPRVLDLRGVLHGTDSANVELL